MGCRMTYVPNPGPIAAGKMAGFRAEEVPESPHTEDSYAHAPGKECARCGSSIEADQVARRTGETAWIHDICPVRGPGD